MSPSLAFLPANTILWAQCTNLAANDARKLVDWGSYSLEDVINTECKKGNAFQFLVIRETCCGLSKGSPFSYNRPSLCSSSRSVYPPPFTALCFVWRWKRREKNVANINLIKTNYSEHNCHTFTAKWCEGAIKINYSGDVPEQKTCKFTKIWLPNMCSTTLFWNYHPPTDSPVPAPLHLSIFVPVCLFVHSHLTYTGNLDKQTCNWLGTL